MTKQMKIALTGATGFIGSHILTELVSNGHAVTALVRDDVVAGGAVILEDPAEHIGQIGDMDGAPVLSTGAEHDQIAVAVPGGSEQDSGDPASTIAVSSA